jgi:Sec-independent protein secretion pathway component TatC
MASRVHDDLHPSRGGRLLVTVRDHRATLAATLLVAALLAAGAVWSQTDRLFGVVVPSLTDGPVLAVTPVDLVVFTVEAAVGGGLLVSTGVCCLLAFRDAGSFRGAARRPVLGRLAAAAALFCVGVAAGAAWALPAVLDLLAAGVVPSGFDPATHAVWTAELVVFLPVVVGTALALPAVVAAAFRGGVVGRETLSARLPLALLFAVVVAAVFTPPDSLTFALVVGLLLGSYGLATLTVG